MAKNEIHVGDIGTVFTATIKDGNTAVDLSGATTKQLKFHDPDGVLITKDAAFVTGGSDGGIKYTTISGDLSKAGQWKLQGYVVLPSGSWHTDIVTFTVYDVLE